MQEKNLLINSMQKLINHIIVSKKNQEEIFASLTKNDFQKIISNLQDENHMLRKVSLILITQLLYNNHSLKEIFCKLMTIPNYPGRIVLNSKFMASNSRITNIDLIKQVENVFCLVKQPIHQEEKTSLFWFVNHATNTYPLKIEQMTNLKVQKSTISDTLDPLECMIGFIMPDKNERFIPKKVENKSQIHSLIENGRRGKSEYQPIGTHKMVNNFFRPKQVSQWEQIKTETGTMNHSLNNSTNLVNSTHLNNGSNFGGGFSTDRDMHYIPKSSNLHYFKANTHSNTQNYPHNMTMSVKTSSDMVGSNSSNQGSQIKNAEYDPSKSKQSGIKIVSSNSNNNSTTKNINKDYNAKYFEENPIFHMQTTTNSSKIGQGQMQGQSQGQSQMQGQGQSSNIINNVNNSAYKAGGMTISGGKIIERGYETLRQKKIIQKYPY